MYAPNKKATAYIQILLVHGCISMGKLLRPAEAIGRLGSTHVLQQVLSRRTVLLHDRYLRVFWFALRTHFL